MANVFMMQMCVIWNRKSTIVMYVLMCGLVILNFMSNVKEYVGYNVWNMYHPMRLVLLGDYSFLGFAFMQYFPFLLVIPAAFTYFNDRNCREYIIIQTKTNRNAYYMGTMLATFVTTFLVFAIPLFLEVMINCIAFPVEALGDQSNISLFENKELIENYLFSQLWIANPYAYTFLMIGLFGIIAGILACFASACSLIGRTKFKVLIFVPVYALMYILMLAETIFDLDYSTNYFYYLRLFCYEELNEWYLGGLMAMLTTVIGIILVNKMRKDELE